MRDLSLLLVPTYKIKCLFQLEAPREPMPSYKSYGERSFSLTSPHIWYQLQYYYYFQKEAQRPSFHPGLCHLPSKLHGLFFVTHDWFSFITTI